MMMCPTIVLLLSIVSFDIANAGPTSPDPPSTFYESQKPTDDKGPMCCGGAGRLNVQNWWSTFETLEQVTTEDQCLYPGKCSYDEYCVSMRLDRGGLTPSTNIFGQACGRGELEKVCTEAVTQNGTSPDKVHRQFYDPNTKRRINFVCIYGTVNRGSNSNLNSITGYFCCCKDKLCNRYVDAGALLSFPAPPAVANAKEEIKERIDQIAQKFRSLWNGDELQLTPAMLIALIVWNHALAFVFFVGVLCCQCWREKKLKNEKQMTDKKQK